MCPIRSDGVGNVCTAAAQYYTIGTSQGLLKQGWRSTRIHIFAKHDHLTLNDHRFVIKRWLHKILKTDVEK